MEKLSLSNSVNKRFKSVKKNAAMLIVAMCLVQGAWANSATEIATIIRDVTGNQLTATVSDNTVTVTGTIPATPSGNYLTFGIDAGTTVIWEARLTGTPTGNNSLITISGGSGTFRVESGGLIENIGTGRAITNNSAGTVAIQGGTVRTTGGGTVIHNASTGTVNVSSGRVENTGTNGGIVIHNQNSTWNHLDGTTSISGGTVSATNGTAISGNAITVSGGTVSATTGTAISGTTITITNGTVSTTTGTAVNLAGSHMVTATVSISGGIVSATTGTAIDDTGVLNTTTATISGNAQVTSAGTNTIRFRSGEFNINGGTVENTANGTAISPNFGILNINSGTVRSASGNTISCWGSQINISGGTVYTAGSGRSAVDIMNSGAGLGITTITGGTVSAPSDGFAISKAPSVWSPAFEFAKLRIGGNPIITGRIFTFPERLEVITSGADAFNPGSRVYTLDFPAAQYANARIAVMNGGVNDGVWLHNFRLYDPNWELARAGTHLAIVPSTGYTTWNIGSPIAADVTATLSPDGTLTISGTGAMMNWWSNTFAPWHSVRESIQTVVINEGVTTIGQMAFYVFARNLTSIDIPNSVTTIEGWAFSGATGLTSITVHWDTPPSINSNVFSGVNTSNVQLIIPPGTADIYRQAPVWRNFNIEGHTAWDIGFSTASDVQATSDVWATLSPDGTLTISGTGSMMNWFSNNFAPWHSVRESIQTVVINEGVTTIGVGAFRDATGLTSITIPNSVTTIGNLAFQSATGLTSITIPYGVTTIGNWAFSGTGLTSVTIPNSVTTIGDHAFRGATGLTSIDIPNSVTTIGEGMFMDATGLTSITIPNSVTTIGYFAFSGATGLTSIDIPNSVTTIGDHAFRGATGLTSITVHWDIPPSISSNVFSETTIANARLIIPSGTADIYRNTPGWRNFNIEGHTAWDIGYPIATDILATLSPDGVLTISGAGEMQSWNWSNIPWRSVRESIQTVVINEGVTTIGDQAFEGATGLTSITIPNSITTIGCSAFRGATGLTSITVHWDTPPSIFSNVFDGINIGNVHLIIPPGTADIYRHTPVWGNFIIEGMAAWHIGYPTASDVWATLSPDGTLTISGTGEMMNWTRWSDTSPWHSVRESIQAVVINEGISTIGTAAFWDATRLTSINIPNSVTTIGIFAFQSATGLTSINAATDNPNFSSVDGVLFNRNQTALIRYPLGRQGDYIIPNSVTTIGDFAFQGATDLTSITIPNSVTMIGNHAFCGATGLTSINIPNSVTTIGDWAFNSATGLTSIDIPNSVTTIGEGMFWGATSLTSIDIPNSVTTIGDRAFLRATGLTSINIPNSVTTIGDEAFSGVTGLTSITVHWDTPPSINSNVFSGVNTSSVQLIIPPGTADAYRQSLVWQNFNIGKTAMEAEVSAINVLIAALADITTSEDLQAAIDEINRRVANWEGTPLVGIDVETLDKEMERVEVLREQEAIAVTGVSLNLSQLILEIGETQTLIATITPNNATNQNVVWTSNNSSVVTVNEDGKLVAIAEGTAIITVTTKDGEFETSSEITVDAYIDYSWLPIPKAVLIERDDHLEVRIVGPTANTFNRLEIREFTVRGTNIELDMEVRSTVTEIPLTDGRWIIPFPAGKVEIRITNPAGVVITRKYQ